MEQEIDRYIAAQPPAFASALRDLRARLCALLPNHLEVMSYAMPGLRQPEKGGKMVVGYAGFSRHIGVYPHSGRIIGQIDCAPYRTSKSGFMYPPENPAPDALLRAVIDARLAEIAAAHARAKGG